jgi:hypothetical protein
MRQCESYKPRASLQTIKATRGAALVEMAIMLPVLVILFIGMVEFGHFIMMRERVNKIANQVNGSLYQMNTAEAANEQLINNILGQVKQIAKPYRNPAMNLRFCDYRNGILHRIYRNPASSLTPSPSCVSKLDIPCSGQAHSTKEGHGLFVQTTACIEFQPLIIGQLLEVFGVDVGVATTAYQPMTDANQSALILALPHGDGIQSGGPVPESGTAPNPNQCPITTCPPGKTLTGTGANCSCTGSCSTSCTQIGQTQLADCRCVREECPPGYSLYNGQCIGWPRDCTEETGNACLCQPPGIYRNGRCEIDEWCPEGQMADENGQCTAECKRECEYPYNLDEATCSCKYGGCAEEGEEFIVLPDGSGTCVKPCARGDQRWDAYGNCVDRCPAPHTWNGQHNCSCATGYTNDAEGGCVPLAEPEPPPTEQGG